MAMQSSREAIFIVTGETSGDLHGAHLVRQLKSSQPALQFFAMGGKHLAAAGANLVVDASSLAIIGIVEVLGKLFRIRSAFKTLLKSIKQNSASLVILIDYSGFNLRLAKAIKKKHPHIKILYYISPQIWAWRYRRIHMIKKYVDVMAVIFPFEVPLYQQKNIPVHFVGHPLAKQVVTQIPLEKRRQLFDLREQTTVIGLMPGSRQSEIKNHLPVLLESAKKLFEKFPHTEFVLPLAPNFSLSDLAPYLQKYSLPLKLVQQHTYDLISCCQAVIVASGTATLEVALLGVPMVIIYRGSSISFAIAKHLIKMNLQYIGLCNIVAGQKIVQELLQQEMTPDNIVIEVSRLLTDAPYRQTIITHLENVREQLQSQTISKSLEQLVTEMLSPKYYKDIPSFENYSEELCQKQ